MERGIAEERLVDFGDFPGDVGPHEFANTCRRAVLQILAGARDGWGKRELALWLSGPYRTLTFGDAPMSGEHALGLRAGVPDSASFRRSAVFAQVLTLETDTPAESDLTPVPASGVTVPEDRVSRLLADMRTDVVFVLRELMTPEGLTAFAAHAAMTELVGRARDTDGNLALVPRARGRMSLVDRVLSLVAVDALLRPEGYEHSLFVCERCDAPVFDVASRPAGVCAVHVSGVGPKGRAE